MTRWVLSISSDPTLRDDRDRFIKSLGYGVVSTEDLVGALEALEEHEFDAVLIGDCLPLIKRCLIAMIIRERCAPGTPVLSLVRSSAARPDDVEIALPVDEQRRLVQEMERLIHLREAGQIDAA